MNYQCELECECVYIIIAVKDMKIKDFNKLDNSIQSFEYLKTISEKHWEKLTWIYAEDTRFRKILNGRKD